MGVFSSILDGVGAVAGLWGAAEQAKATQRSNKLQRQTFEWQKQAQEKSWEREDTSVQRRATDLEAAGLSKTLAAGSGAQTMSPINLKPPTVESAVGKGISKFGEVMSMMKMREDIATTRAQRDLLISQNDKVKTETAGNEIANEFAQGSNPVKLDSMQIQLAFDKMANPQRLEQLSLENKNKGLKNVQEDLNNQLRELQITDQQVDIIRNNLGVKADRLGIKGAELENIAKQLAIEIKKSDWQRWTNMGLPTNAGLDMFSRPGAMLGGMAQDIWDKFIRALRGK